MPTPSPAQNISTVPEAGWLALLPGLERRTILLDDNLSFALDAVRVDPERFAFRVHYRPDEPLTIEAWRRALPEALVIINANFFDPQRRALGLLVVEGNQVSAPYLERGGVFWWDGQAVFVANTPTALPALPSMREAIQAFPMLVEQGRSAHQQTGDRITRRTAIGQDDEGRIILMATPGLGPGLGEFSAYLAASDLGLQTAFNLDGGGSTMLYVQPADYQIRSRDGVPAVLAVYPR